jgi:transposase
VGKKWFSRDFKDAVITKIVSREGQTIAEVCNRAGISLSTGVRWVSERDMVPAMKNSKWTAEAKMNAVFQCNNLNEEEFGAFLRKEGLHSHQIKGWRTEILAALGPTCRKQNKDNNAHRIRELERDLHRKDKALAEASALLILQKKVNLIWGNKSEDEK